MTIETKSTIELGDVIAVEFRCPQCQAVSKRLLNEYLTLPYRCENCDQQYYLPHAAEAQELHRFLLQLAAYSDRKMPYSLRFEVTGMESDWPGKPKESTR